MSEIQVNKISPSSGTSITLGDSGDTFTIPSGATFTNNGTATGFGLSVIETPYAARMYNNANQNILNATHTEIDLISTSGVKVYDKGNIATLSNARITVPSGADGLWLFKAHVKVANFRANRNIVKLYKNGTALSDSSAGDNFEMGYWGASNQNSTILAIELLNLSAGDYVAPYFYQNSGGTEVISEKSFGAFYLGALS